MSTNNAIDLNATGLANYDATTGTFTGVTVTQYSTLVGAAGNDITSIAIGSAGQVFQSAGAGANPAFSTATYPITAAVGDILYGSALNTVTGLAFDATATRYLKNTGTGATLPEWGQVTLTDGVTGILPVANGGTGVATLASHGILLGNAAGVVQVTAEPTDGQVPIGSTGNFPVLAVPTGSNGITVTGGAGTLDISSSGTITVANTWYVTKNGNDGNTGQDVNFAKLTIQAAVTAAAAGDAILVYPGTYTETITHAANNITLRGQGKPGTCVITQADANVVDVNTQTGIFYEGFRIVCTAATTAINTIQLSTGSATFRFCRLEMYCAAAIAAVAQPAIGAVTGAGMMIIAFGRHKYYHTGNGGATAQKGAFKVGTGGEVDLTRIEEFDIINSGTALATTVGIDTSSTGFFKMNGCNIEITDPDATVVAGLAYLGGTGTENEFRRNTIHINVTNNIGYGFFASDTASLSRFFYNHIHITDVAGTSFSYHVGNTATVVSVFDDIIAVDGIQLVAGGTFTCTSSLVDGDFTCRGREAGGIVQSSVMNMDNTATASNAAVNVSVGGATSIGDPYTNYLVTGAGTYSVGIDNSDSDNFKITSGATPSAGTDLFKMTSAGVITLNNDLDVSEGGTGVSTLTAHGILLGNGASDIQALGAGATGTVLIGNTGADPSFSATPSVTSITISNSPSSTTDGTNKAYVDGLAAGFDHKDTTVAASTVALTVTYDNGASGVGATLTNADAQAAFSLDGESPTVGQRVLIKDQADTFENGIYTVTDVGSGATDWILTRATDYDTALEMQNGSLVPVSAGTINSNTLWMQNVTVVTIGTDAVTYQKFQSAPISTTQYDVLVGAVNDSVASVGPGTQYQVLQSGGAAANPAYSTATYPATTAQGDLLLSSAANTITALAKDANATRYLSNTGADNNAAWAQVALTTGVSGILPIANGGTNASSMATTYGVNYYDGTRIVTTAVGTAGRPLVSNGAGVAPTFQALATTQNWTLVDSQTASASADIQFLSLSSSKFYQVLISAMLPATSTDYLIMEVSQNNGSTWITTGYNGGVNYSAYNSASANNANSTAHFVLSGPLATTMTHVFTVNFAPTNLGTNLIMSGYGTWRDTTLATNAFGNFGGYSTTGINAVRFRMSTGNIASGYFSLYKQV